MSMLALAVAALVSAGMGPVFAQVNPPSLGEGFGASSLSIGRSTTLTFVIVNSNNLTLTGIGFTDSLPAGLVVATPNGLSGPCANDGTITATAGGNSISLSGAFVPAASACSFTVNVTATNLGNKVNTTSNITSDQGTGGPATASLDVTQFISEYPVITSNSAPYFIAAAPDGALWFTEFVTNKIGRITTGGADHRIHSPYERRLPSRYHRGAGRRAMVRRI